jgi:hypothetical protein
VHSTPSGYNGVSSKEHQKKNTLVQLYIEKKLTNNYSEKQEIIHHKTSQPKLILIITVKYSLYS